MPSEAPRLFIRDPGGRLTAAVTKVRNAINTQPLAQAQDSTIVRRALQLGLPALIRPTHPDVAAEIETLLRPCSARRASSSRQSQHELR